MIGVADPILAMAGPGTHVILSARLEFDLPELAGAAALQQRLSQVFWRRLVGEADRILTAAATSPSDVRLGRLELDVGALDPDRLESQLVERFIATLDDAVSNALARHRALAGRDAERVANTDRRLEMLAHFLAHGSIPWWWTEELGTGVETLLTALAAELPGPMSGLLADLGRREAVRRRLVLQFSDESLRRVVEVLEPREATFIIGYAEALQKEHAREAVVAATSRQFRDAKWELILRQLLVDRGSEFNRKQFLRGNIAGLARRFRVSYERLLEHLVAALPPAAPASTLPSLARLLLELRRESKRAVPGDVGAPIGRQGPHRPPAAAEERHYASEGTSASERWISEAGFAEDGARAGTAAIPPLLRGLGELLSPRHQGTRGAAFATSSAWAEALTDLARMPRSLREAFWRAAVWRSGPRRLARELAERLPATALARLLRAVGNPAMTNIVRRLVEGPLFRWPMIGTGGAAPPTPVWRAAFELLAERPGSARFDPDEWTRLLLARLERRFFPPGFDRGTHPVNARYRAAGHDQPGLRRRTPGGTEGVHASPGTAARDALQALHEFFVLGKPISPSPNSAQPGSPDALLIHVLATDRRHTLALIRDLGRRRDGWGQFARKLRDDTLSRIAYALHPQTAAMLVPLSHDLVSRDVGRKLIGLRRPARRRLAWQATLQLAARPAPARRSAAVTLADYLDRVAPRRTHVQSPLVQRLARAARLDATELGRAVLGVLANVESAPPQTAQLRTGDQAQAGAVQSGLAARRSRRRAGVEIELRILERFVLEGRFTPKGAPRESAGGPDALLIRLLVEQRRPTLAMIRALGRQPGGWERFARRFQHDTLGAMLASLQPATARVAVPMAQFLAREDVSRQLPGTRISLRRRRAWQAALAFAARPGPRRDQRSTAATLAAWLEAVAPSLGTVAPTLARELAAAARRDRGQLGREVLALLEGPHGPKAMRDGHEPGRASLLASRITTERTAARQEPRPAAPRFMEGHGGSDPGAARQPAVPSGRDKLPADQVVVPGPRRHSRSDVQPLIEAFLEAEVAIGSSGFLKVEGRLRAWLEREPWGSVAVLRALRRQPAGLSRFVRRVEDATLLRLVQARVPQLGLILADYAEAWFGDAADRRSVAALRQQWWETLLGVLAVPGIASWDLKRLLNSHLTLLARRQGTEVCSQQEAARSRVLERRSGRWRRLAAALTNEPRRAAAAGDARARPCPGPAGQPARGQRLRHDLAGRLRLFHGFLQEPRRADASLLPRLWEAALSDRETLYRELLDASPLRPASASAAVASGGFDALLRMLTETDASWRREFGQWIHWLENTPAVGRWLPFPPRQLRWRVLLAVQSGVRRARTLPRTAPQLVLEALLEVGVWPRVLRRWHRLAGTLGLPDEVVRQLPQVPAPVGLARLLLAILQQSGPALPFDSLAPLDTLSALLPAERPVLEGAGAAKSATARPDRQSRGRTVTPIPRKSQPQAHRAPGDSASEPLFVTNAGLVVVAPFFPRYFEVCHLLADGQFKDRAAADRAVHLVQHLLTFDRTAVEHTVVLNKVLCGLDVAEPVPVQVELTGAEHQAALDLLDNALRHWGRVTLSLEGFRNSFLWRPGKLARHDDHWKLTVERRAYDLLLTSVPWSFSVLKASYMPWPLYVNWV